jgi:hypothetical protein
MDVSHIFETVSRKNSLNRAKEVEALAIFCFVKKPRCTPRGASFLTILSTRQRAIFTTYKPRTG